MSPSIRRRLLSVLLPTIIGAWLITGAISYFDTKQNIADMLDYQLAQSGKLLLAMSSHELIEQRLLGDTPGNRTEVIPTELWQLSEIADNQMAFQVWVNDELLALRSRNAPLSHMSNKTQGFENTSIANQAWRVYRVQSDDQIISVEIAASNSMQNHIPNNLINAIVFPLLICTPLLAIFIWFGIDQSLLPFKKIAARLSQRKTIDLTAIDESHIPTEILPLTSSVNHLFAQMKTAFDTERRFTADAAHELRTPLAALKTHAEIALKADNATEQRQALSKVVQGVNRATRLVEQLLTLARLDPDTGFKNIRRFDLFILAEDILSTQALLAIDKNIEISLTGTRGKFVAGNSDAIGILMRNLIDNAIRYTPKGGEVEVSITRKENTIIWSVADSGPGIPEEERSKIFNRFYRSLGTKESGSGLGLSIVTRIADLHYLSIQLATSKMGGLQIDVLFAARDDNSTGSILEPAKPV
ncbi:MAG TPA: hypothetical protein ENK06_12240 [Gammaproteobacteria bacterium]|nr:hypothetical protein [Gammaproteobacteria bacterium]